MTDLSQDEAFVAEVYATKVMVMCLTHSLLLLMGDDKEAVAAALLDTASNSVDHFNIRNSEPERVERIRASMHERVQQMIASVTNPGQVPPTRRTPDKS